MSTDNKEVKKEEEESRKLRRSLSHFQKRESEEEGTEKLDRVEKYVHLNDKNSIDILF